MKHNVNMQNNCF